MAAENPRIKPAQAKSKRLPGYLASRLWRSLADAG
jgi:hypothetical protein